MTERTMATRLCIGCALPHPVIIQGFYRPHRAVSDPEPTTVRPDHSWSHWSAWQTLMVSEEPQPGSQTSGAIG
jgi:hypothetical protein